MTRPSRRTTLAALVVLAALAGGAYLWLAAGRRVVATARDAAARREFTTALELLRDPLDRPLADPDALLLGARTARRAGRPDLADAYLRRYVERGGDAETAAVERILGGVQRGELGGFDGGLRYCDTHPGHPEVPFVLEALAEGYLKAGHLVGATGAAARWLAANPPPADQARALVVRGECYRSLGNLDLALADARAALARDPASVDAHALAADALTGPDPAAALAHYAAVLAADPARAAARVGAARAHRNRGDAAAARAELDAVLAADPRNVPALVERARLRIDGADLDGAARDAHEALALDTRSRDALAVLVRVYQVTGREREEEETRGRLKAIEAELYRLIRERVAAGLIPPPPAGTDLTPPAGP